MSWQAVRFDDRAAAFGKDRAGARRDARGRASAKARSATDAQQFIKAGRKEYEIVADIDRLARDKGAEDIRILAGEKRLNPPSFKQAASLGNHWAVYLAVQHERYWAEAGRTFILSNDAQASSGVSRKRKRSLRRWRLQLKPGGAVAAIDETARRALGEFYATASMYGLANGIGLNQWEAPFLNEDDARQVGATSVGATMLNENMTLALRVTFESEGKMILFGDSFEVTAERREVAAWRVEEQDSSSLRSVGMTKRISAVISTPSKNSG